MATLFISDLHLDAGAPAITEQFLGLLATRAKNIDGLYILGDLFEVWVGDDDDDPHNERILTALRDVGRQLPVYFMRGNRDFIAGERFAERGGLTLLDDPCVVDIDGRRILLSHGDAWCTDDHAYQAFRRQTRDPAWQAQILALPLEQRRAFAAEMRQQSHLAMAGKSAAIMDVNSDTIRTAFREHAVTTMVHGHTHRPAVHRTALGGAVATRIVLGDWYDQASYLRLDGNGWRLGIDRR